MLNCEEIFRFDKLLEMFDFTYVYESPLFVVLMLAIIELDFPLVNIFVRLNKYLTSTFTNNNKNQIKK